MILKELVKILQICQVIALILSSANAFPHAKARFVFPEVESLASFAEPRGLTFGSSSEREELGKRPIIPRTEAKISLGFQKVIQSATKKPTRHKPLNFKPDKIVFGPSIINKTKIYDENTDVEVLPSLKPGGRTKEDMVFFPDDVELITTSETPSDRSDQDDQLQGQPSFEAKPCANDVMCDDSEEYPGDAVLRRVLSNFEAVKEFFRQEADVSLQASIDIGTRRGQGNSPLDPYYEVDEKPLCIAEVVILLLSLLTSHTIEAMSNTTVSEERSFQTKKQLYYEDTQSDGYRKPTFESYPGKPFYTFPHLPQDLSTPDLYTQPPAASVNYAQSYVPQPQQQYLATPNPYIITAPTGSYGASNPVYGSPQHSYSSQKPTNLGYYDAYVVPPAESTYDSYEPSYQGGGYEDEYSGGYGHNKGYKHPYKSYPDVEGMKKYFLFKVYGSLVKAKGALLIGVGKILKLKGKILLAKGEALEDIGYYLKDVKFNTYMSDPYGYGHEDDILEDLIEKGHKHKGYKKSKKANGFKKPKKSYGISKGPPYVHEDSYYKRRKSGIGKSVDLLPAGSTNQDDINVEPGSSQGPPIPLSLSNSESKEENKPARKLQKEGDSNLTTKQSLLPTPKRARIKLRNKKIIKPSPTVDSGFKPMLGVIDCDGCVEIPNRNGWQPI